MSSEATHTMLRLLGGYWISQTLYVVAELGIADALSEGPADVRQLAQRTGCNAGHLHRLLRGLASAGILSEPSSGVFAQTELSETLRSDVAGSLRNVARLGGHPAHWAAWGKLLHAVRTGETAFEAAHGMGLFELLANDPALSSIFQRVLGGLSQLDETLAITLPISEDQQVLDVGGGTGQLARALVKRLPKLRACVLDRPEVVRECVGIEARAADFMDEVPSGFDVYLAKFVVQDFDDERATTLLRNVAGAMSHEARLFVIEAVLPNDTSPSAAKTHDVNMLVLTGGKQRTIDEHRALLSRSGLTLSDASRTAHEARVIEARRAT